MKEMSDQIFIYWDDMGKEREEEKVVQMKGTGKIFLGNWLKKKIEENNEDEEWNEEQE